MSARKRREQLDNDFFDMGDDLPTLDIKQVDDIGFGGLSLPMARREGEIVQLGAFHVSVTGLQIQGSITQDEWIAFFDGIQKIESAVQFIIGDLAAYGEDEFNLSYEEIGQLTGYKPETVENYAYIARNVKHEIRNPELSFNHHYQVAKLSNDTLKSDWLTTAQEHNLSVRNMKLALQIWEDGGNPEVVFDNVDDKQTPVQKSRLKMAEERTKVMQKAKKKKSRKEWLIYAREQAAEWQELVARIQNMPDPE